MNIPFELRQELLQLLMQIPNPESVAIAPNVSDPKYKYYFMEDGTIKAKERSRLSNGQLGN
jgi:hypothetical protein